MEEYQKRVTEERDQLASRVKKLGDFIAGPMFERVEHNERLRMKNQYEYMLGYKEALDQRIDNFGVTNEPQRDVPKPA